MEARVEIRTTPEQAQELIGRLAEDDDFRAQVEKNPVETLAKYGIRVPAAFVEGQRELPSPEEMAKIRDQIEGGELDPASAYGPLASKFGPMIWIVAKLFAPLE
jgi:putative modified peptide